MGETVTGPGGAPGPMTAAPALMRAFPVPVPVPRTAVPAALPVRAVPVPVFAPAGLVAVLTGVPVAHVDPLSGGREWTHGAHGAIMCV
ncbi:hypothetical protein GCM10017687_80950 [Streptomyces echinatus]